jgi:thiamine pyrophosphokinase
MDNIVILANGDFPRHKIPLEILLSSSKIICCDGAVNKLEFLDLSPNIIIGDLDSISNKLKIKYSNQLLELPNQSDNDLRKAINWVEKNDHKSAVILGATGERDDHNLGNIFTLLEYQTTLDLSIVSNYGTFSLISKETTLKSFIGQQVSLFSIDKTIKITSYELKFNLKNSLLKSLYSGTLNESNSNFITIKISHGSILIYQAFK